MKTWHLNRKYGEYSLSSIEQGSGYRFNYMTKYEKNYTVEATKFETVQKVGNFIDAQSYLVNHVSPN